MSKSVADFLLGIADNLDTFQLSKQADIVSDMAIKVAKSGVGDVIKGLGQNYLYNAINQQIGGYGGGYGGYGSGHGNSGGYDGYYGYGGGHGNSGGKKSTEERSKEAFTMEVYENLKSYIDSDEYADFVRDLLDKKKDKNNILYIYTKYELAKRIRTYSERMQNVDWETSGEYSEGYVPWFETTNLYSDIIRLAYDVIKNISEERTGGRYSDDGDEYNMQRTPQVQKQTGSSAFVNYLNKNRNYILDTFDKNTDEYEEVNSQNAYAVFKMLWPSYANSKQAFGVFYTWLQGQYE